MHDYDFVNDTNLWSPPPPPIMDEDYDDTKEWVYEVVGEEVDSKGVVYYEVEWPEWRRQDGSQNTWDNRLVPPNGFKKWNTSQNKLRKQLASQSDEIDIHGSHCFNLEATHSRHQAVQEKFIKSGQNDMDLPQTLIHRTPNNDASSLRIPSPSSMSPPPPPQLPTPRSTSANSVEDESIVVESRRARKGKRKSRLSPNEKGRKRIKQEEIEDIDPRFQNMSASSSRSQSTRHSANNRDGRTRGSVSELWNANAKENHASTIKLVNDEDDEELPDIPENFKYTEIGYIFHGRFKPPDPAFLLGCECTSCIDLERCSCQEIFDPPTTIFPYSPQKLFLFNSTNIIVECNKQCNCDESCRNRVAQLPRDIPIEVFKTRHCGWGVRSPQRVKRGKVLGTYSGKVITNLTATKTLSHYRKNYCFDLDYFDPEHPKYIIDSYKHGNWTRFLNHSCDPNIGVYPVMFDPMPTGNTDGYIYHLAFIALREIPSQVEFTLDYNPTAILKGTTTQKTGSERCRCGTKVCRGWIR